MQDYQKATFAGGCFWCIEAVFNQVNGVVSAISGYTGGKTENPTYRDVSYNETGHAEAVEVTFDPSIITYEELLEIFWHIHNPTTLNRQGADVGTQYRSAIFYHSEEQKQQAEASKAKIEAEKLYSDPIVTEIVPAPKFYVAEDYHQEYFKKNPNQGYCQVVISPKMGKFRAEFAKKLKPSVA